MKEFINETVQKNCLLLLMIDDFTNIHTKHRPDQPRYYTLMNSLNAFDEYPVENFHSILRAQTSEADDGELLRRKAKSLDFSKVFASNLSVCF